MPPESIFLLVSTAVAVLLGAGAVVAALRAAPTRPPSRPSMPALPSRGRRTSTRSTAPALSAADAGPTAPCGWRGSPSPPLIGVGLSDAYDDNQAAIYALGAIAVVAAVGLHDLLPDRRRTPAVVAFEVVLAIVLTTGLLVLTGYASSPFAFIYLDRGGRGAGAGRPDRLGRGDGDHLRLPGRPGPRPAAGHLHHRRPAAVRSADRLHLAAGLRRRRVRLRRAPHARQRPAAVQDR